MTLHGSQVAMKLILNIPNSLLSCFFLFASFLPGNASFTLVTNKPNSLPLYIYPMMNDLSNLSQYAIFPDEAYSTDSSFATTVGFLKFLANDPDENLSVTDEILVIELKEGVFIRSRNTAWSERLSSLVKQPVQDYPVLKLFPVKKLDDLVRDYRSPIDSFGDYRLLRWKVGF